MATDLNALSDSILKIGQLGGAAGLLGMAAAEILKELTWAQGHYRRWRTRRWLMGRARAHQADADVTYRRLLEVTGRDESALFGCDTDTLQQQLRGALSAAMRDATEDRALLQALTGRAISADDAAKIAAANSDAAPTDEDSRLARRTYLAGEGGLSGLTLSVDYWWKQLMRALSAAATLGATLVIQRAAHLEPGEVALIALVGAAIAPVYKDLMAAAELLRRK